MSLRNEISEQPAVLRRLLHDQAEAIDNLADAIHSQPIHSVYLAARGTSDNAARYAQYVWGIRNQLPVALATPSIFSVYQSPPKLRNALVVGISQSGQSPDIVEVLAEAARQGAPTLAITNDPNSPLARTAQFTIEICAGPEKAIAATKTYTAQLMVIAMLSEALSRDKINRAELARVPAWTEAVLDLSSGIASMVETFAKIDRCVVLGRGYNYATAFEWSLKLKELTYAIAEPYSPPDFQHGPVAMVDADFPVLAAAPSGAVVEGTQRVLSELIEGRGIRLIAISNHEPLLSLTPNAIRLPSDLPEWLSPLVAIVPAQLFSYHLACAKGHDVESPRGLSKVTRTL